MTTSTTGAASIAVPLRISPSWVVPWRLIERNALVFKRVWWVLASGFLEPFFYLLSIGVGVGGLVGDLNVGGHEVSYTTFVAPAMVATAAMNGAIAETTFNLFFRLKFAKFYDAVMATPVRPLDAALAEAIWAVLRGALYSIAFELIMWAMGVLHSYWALLLVPMTALVGFAFAGAGILITTFLRSWQDFEFITIAQMPMFLFSATFYPIDRYPAAVAWIVRCTPLYRGVSAIRDLCVGTVGWSFAISVVYLLTMGLVGVLLSGRRFETLLHH